MRHTIVPFDYGHFRDARWEDLRFPAQGINPAGSPAPATPDTNSGALSFAGNVDNVAGGIGQLPHGWKIGSTIKPHVHLRFPTDNPGTNTRWRFDYDVANINSQFTNAPGVFTSLPAVTIPNPGLGALITPRQHVVVDLGDVSLAGFTESAIIIWRVWRLANSDAADNDTNACILLEFDIHYQVGKTGTAWT